MAVDSRHGVLHSTAGPTNPRGGGRQVPFLVVSIAKTIGSPQLERSEIGQPFSPSTIYLPTVDTNSADRPIPERQPTEANDGRVSEKIYR
jgi:hypothetical protein